MAQYINMRRLAQAIGLWSSLSKHEDEDGKRVFTALDHRLLEYLGRRMAPKTIPDTTTEGDTCWPGQATIAKETGIKDRKLRYSLTNLIAFGYLRKTSIPGYTLRGREGGRTATGNHFDGCRYHVTPIWDTIETQFDEAHAKAAKGPTLVPPAAPPAPPRAKDKQILDSLDQPTAAVRDAEIKALPERRKQDEERLFNYLMKNFGSHPSMQDPAEVRRTLTWAFDECESFSDAGAEIIEGLLDTERFAAKLRGSKDRLVAYLKKCLPGWLADHAKVRTTKYLYSLFYGNAAWLDDDSVLARRDTWVLRHHLKDNLLSIDRYEVEGLKCFTFTISDAFAEQWKRDNPPIEDEPSGDEAGDNYEVAV